MRQGARSYLCLFPKCSERTVVCHSQLVEPSPWSLAGRFLLPPSRSTQKWRLHKTSAVATAQKKKKQKENNKEMGNRTAGLRDSDSQSGSGSEPRAKVVAQWRTPKQTRCEPTSAARQQKACRMEGGREWRLWKIKCAQCETLNMQMHSHSARLLPLSLLLPLPFPQTQKNVHFYFFFNLAEDTKKEK